MSGRSSAKATFKDFNPKTPDVNVMGTHENPVVPDGHPTGEYYHYGAYLNTPDEATRKARLRAEMLSCGKETFRGTGIFRGARAGFRFELEGADAEGFDGEIPAGQGHPRGLYPRGGRDGEDGQPHTHYKNAFEAIQASVIYRPPLHPAAHRARPPHRHIEGPEEKYGAIDEEGRYRAKFIFDRSDTKDDKSSRRHPPGPAPCRAQLRPA